MPLTLRASEIRIDTFLIETIKEPDASARNIVFLARNIGFLSPGHKKYWFSG